jgi:hypothetical protein
MRMVSDPLLFLAEEQANPEPEAARQPIPHISMIGILGGISSDCAPAIHCMA